MTRSTDKASLKAQALALAPQLALRFSHDEPHERLVALQLAHSGSLSSASPKGVALEDIVTTSSSSDKA